MKIVFSWLVLSMVVMSANAQSVSTRLSAAFSTFESDSQLKSGIASIYVVDATTGSVVFQKNARIGLAPASTQKIITAATAYELLRRDFRYKTKFGYSGALRNGKPDGALVVSPSGDPTLGSWRWQSTSEGEVMKRLLNSTQKNGITTFSSMIIDVEGWDSETIPGGWIWDDVGNYYGAGAEALNWRENQYDLYLKSGKSIGDAVVVTGTKPRLYNYSFISHVTSAAKGTGDNSYIYLPVGGNVATVRGTIPVAEDRFVISGAMPSASLQFAGTLQEALAKQETPPNATAKEIANPVKGKAPAAVTFFHTETSPSLDSISYWFLKKSINLYGEALAKTMAMQKGKIASSANGAKLIRDYWKEKGIGIDASELNLQDGSGLSPQNRVTTHAQVAVLLYAKKQPWFDGFFAGFPEYNAMKLKSGTIGGAKGFCGYHNAKDGKQYIVSFIVNNYNGSSSTLVQKMYRVLDVLK